MNIVMVASEANPIYKTGGLADVIYALSKQFVKMGHNVSIVVPYYKKCGKASKIKAKPIFKLKVNMNWRNFLSEVYNEEIEGIEYFFISNDQYFDRPNYYGYYDDGERFAFFSNAAIELLKALPFKADIVHVHDWQPGMIPCLLKTKFKDDLLLKGIKTVLTIHNPLFKGYFGSSSLYDFYGLSYSLYENGSVQFDNQVSTLKAAIFYSDKISTVSPTHAYELTTLEGSKGLWYEMILRKDDFVGILNGMDYREFDPSKDKLIYQNYNVEDALEGKKANKKAFCKEHGYDPKMPIFAVVSRLTNQKGLDLMFQMAEFVSNNNGIFAVLGSGEKYAEDYFNGLIARNPKNTYVYIGYSDEIAHKLYASSDFFIMPSAFEPCGLGQMIAQRYGSLPIVRRTGGLKDSVEPYNAILHNEQTADGFGFDNYNVIDAISSVASAFMVYNDKKILKKLVGNAMKRNNTWAKSAEKYIELYEGALKK